MKGKLLERPDKEPQNGSQGDNEYVGIYEDQPRRPARTIPRIGRLAQPLIISKIAERAQLTGPCAGEDAAQTARFASVQSSKVRSKPRADKCHTC